MRIVHIVPGSGGTFYCQNCLRDLALAQAQRAAGHEAVIVPLYLPLAEEPVQTAPVFFGAINVYLEQVCALFRHTPRWFDRLLDAPALLRFLARKATSTRAQGLEGLTLSMLQGSAGNQAKELERLLHWLQTEFHPDLVHLSNALLLGLAPALKQRLQVPVVCSLQDEDVWVEAMDKPAADAIYRLAARQAESVARFFAVSRYYAAYLQPLLHLRDDQIAVVPPGLPLAGYAASSLPQEPPVLGFLSRLAESLGLDILVEAYLALRKDARLASLRLHLCGGLTGDDRAFLDRQLARLAQEGCAESVQVFPCRTREDRQAFLQTLTVLSVPAPRGEALGMFALEANACGVPVVLPDAGGFAETVRATGGGIAYPTDPQAPARPLTTALRELLCDRQQLTRYARAGRRGVEETFDMTHIQEMAEREYRSVLQPAAAPPGTAPLLSVRDIVKSYQPATGEPPVLRGLNLEVEEGEAVAICGPSGSGKSTLLNLLGALDAPDAGTVRLAGRDLAGMSEAELAHLRNAEIGFVFQLHHLLPQLTVLENVLVPGLAERNRTGADALARARTLLEKTGIAHRAQARPAELSGGERQRAAVARALINHPRLVLADEPTGALDPATAGQLIDLLCRLNEEERVTLIVVTHDEAVAARMHKRYRMREGRLQ